MRSMFLSLWSRKCPHPTLPLNKDKIKQKIVQSISYIIESHRQVNLPEIYLFCASFPSLVGDDFEILQIRKIVEKRSKQKNFRPKYFNFHLFLQKKKFFTSWHFYMPWRFIKFTFLRCLRAMEIRGRKISWNINLITHE